MCVIIFKPAGETVSKKNIKQAWEGNSDGFGLMYYNKEEKKVECFKKLKPSLDEIYEWFDKLKDVNAAFHMRITTHGATIEQLCHPFRVTHRKDTGKDLFFMHNGTINKAPKAPNKFYSDTTMFNKKVLQPMLKNSTEFFNSETFVDVVGGYIGSSKLLFLDSDGEYTFVNKKAFSKLDNTEVLVSNKRWKKYETSCKNSYYTGGRAGGHYGYYGYNHNRKAHKSKLIGNVCSMNKRKLSDREGTKNYIVQGSYVSKHSTLGSRIYDTKLKIYVPLPPFVRPGNMTPCETSKYSLHSTYKYGEEKDIRYFANRRVFFGKSKEAEGFIYYEPKEQEHIIVTDPLFITSKPTTFETLGLRQQDLDEITYYISDISEYLPTFKFSDMKPILSNIQAVHERAMNEMIAKGSRKGVETSTVFDLPDVDMKAAIRQMSGSELVNLVSDNPEEVSDLIKKIV